MRKYLVSLIFAAAIALGCTDAFAVTGNANISTATTWCYNTLFQASQTTTKQLFVQPLVKCFTDSQQGIIPSVTASFIQNAQTDYLPIVAVMFVVAIAYYGIRLMIGDVQRVKGDTFILVLKVAAIIYFMNNANTIYQDAINILQQISAITAYAATSQHTTGFCIQTINLSTAPDSSAWSDNLWLRWDCIFGYLLGIGSGSLAVYGIASFLFLMANTMGIGILILAVGLYIILALLTAAFRFVHVYFMAMLSLSFMFCLGYMFVPLMLFRNTIEYFRKWLNLVLGFILTTIMMFGFMGLMLVTLDVALFTGSYSVWATIGGTTYGGPSASAGTGATLFQNLTSNSLSQATDGGNNQNLQDAMKSIFNLATNGPWSEVIMPGTPATYTTTPNTLATQIPCQTRAGAGAIFEGLFGYSSCNVTSVSGATDIQQAPPATSGIGFDQTALNLTYMAGNAGSSCTSTTWNGTAGGVDPVTYYNNCPYAENILISISVAALIAYIMFALISYIPTLASNLGQDLMSNDLVSAIRSFVSSNRQQVFGEGAGQTPMQQGSAANQAAAGAQKMSTSSTQASTQQGSLGAKSPINIMRTVSAFLAGDR